MWLLFEYPPCSTCRKARRFLDDHGINYTARHIVENPPSFEEISTWVNDHGVEIRRLFNTHGKRYRALDIKAKLLVLNKEQIIALLADDGMLVKRPILVFGERVLVGFSESVWRERLLR